MKKVLVIAIVSVFFMSCSGTRVDTKSNLKLTSFSKVFNQWSTVKEGELAAQMEFKHIVTFVYEPNGKSSIHVKNYDIGITDIYRQDGEIELSDGLYGFDVKDMHDRSLKAWISKDNDSVMIVFTSDRCWIYNNMPTSNSASL